MTGSRKQTDELVSLCPHTCPRAREPIVTPKVCLTIIFTAQDAQVEVFFKYPAHLGFFHFSPKKTTSQISLGKIFSQPKIEPQNACHLPNRIDGPSRLRARFRRSMYDLTCVWWFCLIVRRSLPALLATTLMTTTTAMAGRSHA